MLMELLGRPWRNPGPALLAVTALGVLSALSALPLHAQNPTLEVSPSFISLDLAPGKPASFKLTLKTPGDVPQKALLEPSDFSIDRKGKISTEEVRDKRYSGKSWCKLTSSDYVVRKGQEVVIDVPFSAPQDSALGEYYMCIKVSTPPMELQQQDGLKLNVQVVKNVLVILHVSGFTPRFDAEILDSEIKIDNSIPHVDAVFHSKSTIAVVSRIGVTIRDSDRKIYDRFFMKGAGSQQDDGQAFVLPDNFREFSGTGNRKLPAGKYIAEIIAVYAERAPKATKSVDFEIKASEVAPTPPLEDLVLAPAKIVIEMPPAGVKFQVVEFKNQGLNPVVLKFSCEHAWVTCFPETISIEPGKVTKVRVGFRLPPAEDPRRDFTIHLLLEGGKPTDRRPLAVSIYPPGMAPKEEKKALSPPPQNGQKSNEPAPPPPPSAPQK
jgi:hypothetical protein